MIEEKQKEIIEKVKELDEVKRLLYLKEKLNKNDLYKHLLEEADEENADILVIRKRLFEIYDFKEYMKISSNLKLLFLRINNIIVSLIDKNSCKKH